MIYAGAIRFGAAGCGAIAIESGTRGGQVSNQSPLFRGKRRVPIHHSAMAARLSGGPTSMSELDVREAYRLWAPTYAAETATSFLDDELAREMLQDLPRARLLDAGCGIGRRIADIPGAVGIDASPDMLAAGGAQNVVTGDVRAMPFASDCFDMVWVPPGVGPPPRCTPRLPRACSRLHAGRVCLRH